MPRTRVHLGTMKLVIVGGPYKSGTSYLCEAIEKHDFDNPAWITGPPEYGHGIASPRYLTRECHMARMLNRQLISATPRERLRLECEVAGYLNEMFNILGQRIVLKDPYMKLTADVWARAAQGIGVRRVAIYFTVRNEVLLSRSWRNARFISREYRRIPEVFHALKTPSSSPTTQALWQSGISPFYVNALRPYCYG